MAATVLLVRRPAAGQVCSVVRGTTAVIIVTPAMHYRRVQLPAAIDRAARPCGIYVSAFLEVRYRTGNSGQVEGMVNHTGAETLVWLERRGW